MTWIVQTSGNLGSEPATVEISDAYTPGLEENQRGVFLVFRRVDQKSDGEREVYAIFPAGSWEYVIQKPASA